MHYYLLQVRVLQSEIEEKDTDAYRVRAIEERDTYRACRA